MRRLPERLPWPGSACRRDGRIWPASLRGLPDLPVDDADQFESVEEHAA